MQTPWKQNDSWTEIPFRYSHYLFTEEIITESKEITSICRGETLGEQNKKSICCIIPKHQFGFCMVGHTTMKQLHPIITIIRHSFEEKLYCSALFIDIVQDLNKECLKSYSFYHRVLVYFFKTTYQIYSLQLKSKTLYPNSAGVRHYSILYPLL